MKDLFELREKGTHPSATVTAGAKKRPLELCRKSSDCNKGTKDRRAKCFRHWNRRKVRKYKVEQPKRGLQVG